MAEEDVEMEEVLVVEDDEVSEVEAENASEKDEMELVDTLEDTFVEEAKEPIATDAAGNPSNPSVYRPPAKRSKISKKLPSKWIVYLSEQRKAVTEANPRVSFADITKIIAEQYKVLPVEELERIQEVIDNEKARREAAGDADDANDGENSKPEQSIHKLVLPLARIKRLMKIDDDVKIISKEAIAVTTKATELFIARFALKCASTTSLRGGRTVGINDVLHTIHGQSQFEFLDLDFPKPTPTERNKGNKPANPNKNPVKRTKEAAPAGGGSKVEVSNGKYSMLHFVSGSKRSAVATEDDDDEQVEAEKEQQEEMKTAEVSEEEVVAGPEEVDYEVEGEAKQQATSPVIVNSLMDW